MKTATTKLRKKRTPTYWWDFEWNRSQNPNVISGIIIQSNDERFPVIGRITKNESSRALRIIKALNDGRIDPRKPDFSKIT